jgi:antitoxin MazE
MKIKLQKWGNSNAVRIPINIINNLGIKENDCLEILEKDDKIIISKCNYKSINERFNNYNGNYVCEEFEPYNIKGNELW